MAITPDTLADGSVAQNHEAEASVLGAVLLDGDTIATAARLLKPESFSTSVHRAIFESMMRLFDVNRHIDAVTLPEELKRTGSLEAAGGVVYLAELAQKVPSTLHVEHHARIVQENAVMRALTQNARQILEDARAWKGSPRELLDKAEQKIFEVAHQRESSETEHISAIVTATMAQIDSWSKGKISGIQTGFTELDDLTTGLQPSQLVILAARPSMGKTTFALNLAEHVAVQHKRSVAFFSLETAKTQIAQNMLCSNAHLDAHRMRGGYLNREEWSKLAGAAGVLSEAPIFIDDTPGLSVLELKSKARALKAKHNIELVLIDYLQLMEGPATESRQQEITAISRSLKALARELDVTVVALAQLSRAVEAREGNKPRMSDLRESGSIEQDADVILLLYRDDYYDKEKNPNQAQLSIAKQRNGPTGQITLTFLKDLLRFENFSPELETEP